MSRSSGTSNQPMLKAIVVLLAVITVAVLVSAGVLVNSWWQDRQNSNLPAAVSGTGQQTSFPDLTGVWEGVLVDGLEFSARITMEDDSGVSGEINWGWVGCKSEWEEYARESDAVYITERSIDSGDPTCDVSEWRLSAEGGTVVATIIESTGDSLVGKHMVLNKVE